MEYTAYEFRGGIPATEKTYFTIVTTILSIIQGSVPTSAFPFNSSNSNSKEYPHSEA